MKKRLFTLTTLVVVFLAGFNGCSKKETAEETTSPDADLTMLTEKAILSLDNQEVYSDNPELAIYMLDDGIAPCFLADDTDLTGDDSQRTRIRRNGLIACLRGLSLTETQIPLVKQDLRRYNACNEKAISRARAVYNELHETYRLKYNRLAMAYQSGTLTAEEFRTKVAELRVAFKRELRALHLREKLDGAFKRCFRAFLADLHTILNDRQWNAFKECYRGKA